MQLERLGFAAPHKAAIEGLCRDLGAELFAARVCAEQRGVCHLQTETGALTASLTGRMRFDADGAEELPAVGDWVAVRGDGHGSHRIVAVLPRRTALVRQRADRATEAQVIAANVDVVFVMCALNQDFNLRRLERYLAVVWQSGAQPVVLLSKRDLCPDVTGYRDRTLEVAVGAPVHAISALHDEALEPLEPYLTEGTTAVLVGSSGAGKSTLLNRLLGEERMETFGVRRGDDHGRHTTTHRELFVLPGGAMLIDTPGLREVSQWHGGEADEALGAAFDDVEQLARACRFGDCRHRGEPDCAIAAALADGRLAESRWQSYLKLQRELAHAARRGDEKAQLEHRQNVRRITKYRRARLRNHR